MGQINEQLNNWKVLGTRFNIYKWTIIMHNVKSVNKVNSDIL